ncbi:FMN-linked oxidoreductase [Mollisia scopiformis]|uniref:FMN-linked oxidoreductase n=1 Tax=Mollisia scopiformis TaxID=149040 RepID=A0A132B3K3_MOLSC|nr:FMN-linked oxidoreductase [Mollisia scopiformis]KUJ06921.1 FMN-linked oxidoreductase [Mollisia scopiformis]
MASKSLSPTEALAQPLTLPCGLVLPNRLVKCPMQETLAAAPLFDPPIDKFRNLYGQWAQANYGLIITGQVQIDIRFLSITGDVVCHPDSLSTPHLEKWKEWAQIAQSGGTPCIVQLAHPGRMSPVGAGNRPADMPPLCPSSVPVKLSDAWLEKMAIQSLLGTPKAMDLSEIDHAVEDWKRGARVSAAAGFKGVQLHGAHGFLLSQFLSPHTNRRTDEYGGSPEGRMKLLKRLVTEIREEHPAPFCLSVKLNSGDYMAKGGLSQDEALEQVRWLVSCGMVDFVEISGGNAEQKKSGLHNSFVEKSLSKAPKIKESTRIREAYFTEFAERVQQIEDKKCPIQLSGGFRSRTGMADAILSGACDLIGLGRTAVMEPDIPKRLLLNTELNDEEALALPHIVRGQWFSNMIPVKVVGSGLPIQFFYLNMRRLGNGLKSDPDKSIPGLVVSAIVDTVRSGFVGLVEKVMDTLGSFSKVQKIE